MGSIMKVVTKEVEILESLAQVDVHPTLLEKKQLHRNKNWRLFKENIKFILLYVF